MQVSARQSEATDAAKFDAVGAFASHIAQARFEDLPAEAVAKAKTFLLDTIGVGLAGTSDENAGRVLAAVTQWGAGAEATVWGSAARLPAPSAAFANAYRIHCLEYDCIHEAAVVHPMATLLSALVRLVRTRIAARQAGRRPTLYQRHGGWRRHGRASRLGDEVGLALLPPGDRRRVRRSRRARERRRLRRAAGEGRARYPLQPGIRHHAGAR